MDEITVGDPEASVASRVNLIKTTGVASGLCLNMAQYECIIKAHAVTTAPLDLSQLFYQI